MRRRPPRSTRADTLFPYTTRVRVRCSTLFPPAGCGFDPVLLLADFPLSRSDDAPRPDGGRRLLVRAGEDAACLGAATSVLSRSGATRASGFGSAWARFPATDRKSVV